MVDPGFPIGGGGPVGGDDLQRGRFLVEIYAKTTELGPVGGEYVPAAPLGSANGYPK